MSALGEGDAFFLYQLELDVRAELTIAETSQPEEDADGEPDVTMLLDVDAERYEVSLRTLLGAVEAVEDAPPARSPKTGQSAQDQQTQE
jgi:hypothetical protein